eukprot:TRINITY_DN4909_c0_g1_i8.p3 TRINITY_DN4909_c0_g1~~TRINITY_DN4909_c0_g1_i8.p3  ORF type:complete len:218 (-),score=6.83 TRINITY_DN4909_c0_g1_i8:648-1301(-)
MHMGGLCIQNGKVKDCLRIADVARVPTPEAAEQMWRDYFVFAVARNPFSRSASAYNYLLGRRRRTSGGNYTGQCADPDFEQFCKAPYILGVQTRQHACLKNQDQHDFFHVENQAQCYKTADGQIALDFVVSLENLESDFKQLTREIIQHNGGAQDEYLFSISQELQQKQIGPQRGAYAVNMFTQCGQKCFEGIANYYDTDFQFFNYKNCSKNLQQSQ